MLSRKPGEPDCDEAKNKYEIENAMDFLFEMFGMELKRSISGRDILDFGCGAGYQVLSLARTGANRVVGVEIRENIYQRAIELSKVYGIENKVKFITEIGEEYAGAFDIIISKDSFEHYSDPGGVIALWTELLKPQGKIYLTFGPPWWAPYGSHSHFFTQIPWVNILFSESTVMKVRGRFRSDGAKKYEDIEGGLNKMTIKKFEKILSGSQLKASYLKYIAVKNVDFLVKIPGVRELFVNQVNCILTK